VSLGSTTLEEVVCPAPHPDCSASSSPTLTRNRHPSRTRRRPRNVGCHWPVGLDESDPLGVLVARVSRASLLQGNPGESRGRAPSLAPATRTRAVEKAKAAKPCGGRDAVLTFALGGQTSAEGRRHFLPIIMDGKAMYKEVERRVLTMVFPSSLGTVPYSHVARSRGVTILMSDPSALLTDVGEDGWFHFAQAQDGGLGQPPPAQSGGLVTAARVGQGQAARGGPASPAARQGASLLAASAAEPVNPLLLSCTTATLGLMRVVPCQIY